MAKSDPVRFCSKEEIHYFMKLHVYGYNCAYCEDEDRVAREAEKTVTEKLKDASEGRGHDEDSNFANCMKHAETFITKYNESDDGGKCNPEEFTIS